MADNLEKVFVLRSGSTAAQVTNLFCCSATVHAVALFQPVSRIQICAEPLSPYKEIGSMPQTAKLLQRLASRRESTLQEQTVMEGALDRALEMVEQLKRGGLHRQATTMQMAVEATASLIRAKHGPSSAMNERYGR